MADLATFIERLGTPIVFGTAGSTVIAGGYTTTAVITLDALADGAGRMSAEVDLGADHAEEYLIQACVETGTAPAATGVAADFYLAWSGDGTNYPAGVTGSDGAWPADSNEDEWARQLGSPATSLIATADADAVQIQNAVRVRCKGRYVVLVVDNNLGQAFRDEATAANNSSGLVMWPITRVATS